MATGRVNVGSGGSGKLNVYAQMDEPAKKEGIWLKTDDTFNKITNDNQLYFTNDWTDPTLNIQADSPVPYSNKSIFSAVINEKIYVILEGYQVNSATGHGLYIYDPVANTWTLKVSTFPSTNFDGSAMVAVGTDLYFMGGFTTSSVSTAYKYDTIANTWTQITNVPFVTTSPAITLVGRKIYVFGGSTSYGGGVGDKAAVYDIDTNTWTQLLNLPLANTTNYTNAHLYNGNIYFMQSYRMNIYNIEKNTYTLVQLSAVTGATFPLYYYAFYRIGEKFYFAGGRDQSNYFDSVISYDIPTKTTALFSPKMRHFSSKTSGGVLVATEIVNEKIYMFGFSRYAGTANGSIVNAYNEIVVFNLVAKQFDNGTVVLSKDNKIYGSNYYTELITNGDGSFAAAEPLRLMTGFNDAHIYADNDLKKPPAYYGDGTKWVNFRP